MAEAGGESVTPRPWQVGAIYDTVGWFEGFRVRGMDVRDAEQVEAIRSELEFSVNACDRLAPGLPPDKVEASVRALVRTAQGVALAFRDLGFAHAADTLDAALAPFKGLEEP